MEKLTMLDYVRMANDRMSENLEQGMQLAGDLVEEFVASGATSIRIVASGSSRNSADCERPYLQDVLGMQVLVVSPEAYVGFEHRLPEGAFDVFVSQSGYSTNIISALDFARGLGRRTVVLTGNASSPVAQHTDVVLEYGVGIESVDFVTMGVETLILYLMIFAIGAARATGRLDAAGAQGRLAGLRDAIDAHAQALEVARSFVERERLVLARLSPAMFVGNGPNYGVCEEAALKFAETLKRSTSFYEGEEFLHGPEMQIDPSYLVIMVDDPIGSAAIRNAAAALGEVTRGTYLITSHPTGFSGEILLPTISDPLACAIPNLAVFQTICATLAQEMDTWDVHPYLEKVEDSFETKAAGYDDAVAELERRAEESYRADA
jgi:glucoselysine-6-phosphate deglycase